MSRLAFLVLVAVPLAAAPVPKGIKKPPLDGVWEVVDVSIYGQAEPNDPKSPRKTHFWIIKGEDLVIEEADGASELTGKGDTDYIYKLIPADPCNPTSIDMFQTFLDNKPERHEGRLVIDGDSCSFSLSVTDGFARPKTGGHSAVGYAVWKLKRVPQKKLKTK